MKRFGNYLKKKGVGVEVGYIKNSESVSIIEGNGLKTIMEGIPSFNVRSKNANQPIL